MRDLGLMGESSFSLWCGQEGLIANGSRIDKTGWDFFVEFPFDSTENVPVDMQGTAIECKVQVKATDKKARKLPILLSNLRRLVTVQMPAFFVFIEFNGKDSAESVYIVHVDNKLISLVLKRIREIEQIKGKNDFNKRTMTIKYDEANKLSEVNGSSLKSAILRHVDGSMEEYISRKRSFLKSTGFENGSLSITFNTASEENLNELIDMSIGLKKEVEVYNVTEIRSRFGIPEKVPVCVNKSAKFSMPDLAPTAFGKLRFRENKLSPGISFKVKLFVSPFNIGVSDRLKRVRVDGDFFDLVFNPYSSKASYSFSLEDGVQLKIDRLHDALKLLKLLSTPEKSLIADLEFNDKHRLQFNIVANSNVFNYEHEFNTIENAKLLSSFFEITSSALITMHELNYQSHYINQIATVIQCSPEKIKLEFSMDGAKHNTDKNYVVLQIFGTWLGNYIVAVIVSLTGTLHAIEGNHYRFYSKSMTFERKFAVEATQGIDHSELVREFELLEEKFELEDVLVITTFDKRPQIGTQAI